MTRVEATSFLREKLVKYDLKDWSCRLNQSADSRYLGLCLHGDKTIILSAHHIDIHPTPDVQNTICHEVAHAIVGPGHAHDDVWQAKAKEVGCDNTLPCSSLSLSPDIIDAIRSGATVEVTFDEHVIRTPKYNITRLQDKCPTCGKIAKSVKEKTLVSKFDFEPDMKFITLECGHLLIKKIPKGTPFHKFQMGGNPKCPHEWNKNKCILCGRFQPYPFQIEGMRFLEAALAVNNGGGCFDEMGLGKTIQAGGLLYFHPEYWPCLWQVKSAAKFQTAMFLMDWMGDDHMAQIIETSNEWLMPGYDPKTGKGFKHYIIGYDMLVQKERHLKSGKIAKSGFDITQFDRVGIKSVVLDECQQIKNVDSARTQMTRRVVKGRKVIPLSGTPWNNRASELFPVLNMMDHIKFHSEQGFKDYWVEVYWHGNTKKLGGIKKHRIAQFKEYTKDLFIRREQKDVMPELPPVNRTKLYVKMDPKAEEAYDEAVEEFVAWYNSQAAGINGMAIIAAMSKMRHLCGLAKNDATLEYVDEFIEDTTRKLVVFAHHQDVQFILFNELSRKYDREPKKGEDFTRIPVIKYTAEMSPIQRHEAQETFNSTPRIIMVASQLAAGESLNLQTCGDCVMHERQWNPGKEEQCEKRFSRIGSVTSVVNAIYAHLEGITVIDGILDSIVEGKRIRFHALHNTGEAPTWNEDSIMKELAQVIVNSVNAKRNRKILAAK